MKIIDENGKLFSKISLVDIVIVFVLIFLIVSLILGKSSIPNVTNVSNNEIKYTLELKVYGLYMHQREPFSVGDNIYGNDRKIIGKITSIRRENNKSKIKLANGTYTDYVNPQYYDYYLTIEGKGNSTDKGIFSSGSVALIPCNNITVSSRYFSGNSIVLSIEKTA